MKKRILLFTAVAGITSLGISSYHSGAANNGYDCTGAEAAGTGAFVNSTGCNFSGSGCHATAATTGIIIGIELDSAGVATTHYKGGATYTVKITGDGTATSNSRYGFQLSALKDSVSTTTNVDAGTWASTGLPSGTRLSAPSSGTQLTCMEQSSAQSGATFSHSFTWTAPAAGTGTISFWGVSNFVNGNGNADGGDVWNTNHIIIHEWPATSTSTGVAAVSNSIILKAYPNPVTNILNLQMNNVVPGSYTLQVLDMTGRNVATQVIDAISTNYTTVINTSGWNTGNYQLVVANGSERQVLQVTKL